MLFNSLIFIIFGVIFYSVWVLLGRQRHRLVWLTTMSLLFYGWGDWRFLFLLLGNGLIDFYAALLIERFPARKRWFLFASLAGNLGCLAVFKYLGFFTTNLNALTHALHSGWQVPIIQLALPFGISFYTFHSMSYTIDVYRGHMRPVHSLWRFLAFLSMFPALVAGPIMRGAKLLPQLEDFRRTTEQDRWDGLKLIAQGFFMKTIVADNLAPVVNEAFAAATPAASLPYWWLIVTMFAMQIYCDFCGYSLIALGLGRWLGLELPENFRHPYASRSIQEFWTRWHISLSTWFRDYVYIPLGGSRDGAAAAYRNMWLTMLISGLWHGADWTFIVWGAVHAAFLTFERMFKLPERLAQFAVGRFLAWTLLIVQVWIGWVFFRSDSLTQALRILGTMWDVRQLNPAPVLELLALNQRAMAGFGVGILMELGASGWFSRLRLPRLMLVGVASALAVALILVTCVYWRGPGSAFIYFQF